MSFSRPSVVGHDGASLPPGSPETLKNSEAEENFIIVAFDRDDEFNPQNWPMSQRILATATALAAGVSGGWASACESSIAPQAMSDFGVSDVSESLSTGLYLVAFGVCSLIAGPFSETFGRSPVYITTLLLFMIFVMASALAPNIGAQLVFRFFAGWFGCTAVTTFSGSVADLWTPNERTIVFSVATTINFGGIFLAPVVGAYIGQSSGVSWRWVEWVTLIMSGAATTVQVFFQKETFAPIILSWRAKQLRELTGNSRYRSEHELKLEPLLVRLQRSIWRPFDLFLHEITVVLFTIYLTVLYIVSFTFLTGYTFIYGDIYHFSQGSVGLCFLGLVIGIVLGGALAWPLHTVYSRELARAKANGRETLPPESRLWYAMLSAPCLPLGLFWMAWTAFAGVPYWSSLAGSMLIGVTFLGSFISSALYLIDSFEKYAASALAIATFCRYVAAGAMLPVSIPMYKNLGVHWTLTVLGCISLLLTPVPFVFYRYGHVFRQRSRNATRKAT